MAVFHYNLGNLFKGQGKPAEAVACYHRALELKPDHAHAHNNLGNALEEIGDFRGAESCFRTALRHNARLAVAHYKLAELLGGNLPETDLAAQRRLLAETVLTDAQRLFLHFGLAQVLDCGASMPRPPSTSIGATLCNCPSGASAARSTIRKRTRFSSPK